MTLITYPLDNVEYTADDAALFHATRTTGIHAGDDFTFSVNGADNMVTLGPGIAWMQISRFKGLVAAMKAETVVDMGLTDPVYPRIDHLVLQYSANSNATSVVVKRGTAASDPLPPVRSATPALYELHLLQVRREPGAVSISAADVTDLRLDKNWCGLMAESVTNVDTEAISRQVRQILKEVKADTATTLTELQRESAAVMQSINDELKQLHSGSGVELAKLEFTNVEVPVSAFVADNTSMNFPYRGTVVLTGAITSMTPMVMFSEEDALSGNYSPVSVPYNGGVYIYAASPPDTALIIPTILLWRGNQNA